MSDNTDNMSMVTDLKDKDQYQFEVFRRMEFNSDRKRMSIVFQDRLDKKYKLYMKGADTIVLDRLKPES